MFVYFRHWMWRLNAAVFVGNQLWGRQRPKYLSLGTISLERNDPSGCLGPSSLDDAKIKVFACGHSTWRTQKNPKYSHVDNLLGGRQWSKYLSLWTIISQAENNQRICLCRQSTWRAPMTKISVFVYNQLRGCQRPKYLSLAKISLEGANDQSGCLLGTSSLKDAKK